MSSKEYRQVPAYDHKPAVEQTPLQSPKAPSSNEALLTGEPLGMFQIICINFFAFPYSFILSTMGILTLPVECARMFPERKGEMLGIMLGIAGVSQLICPLVGYFSDRCRMSVGKRVPFLLGGAVLVVLGLLGMMWARNAGPTPSIYISALFIALLGLNIMYSAFTAVNADFVEKRQMGIASGVMAILQLTGSCAGFATLKFLVSIQNSYIAYIVTLLVGAAVTCVAILPLESPFRGERTAVSCEDISTCYIITPGTHGDFFWVFMVRLFYYLSMSLQAFLLYYLHDGIGVENAEETLVILVMTSQLVGALVTVPIGLISDNFGRKDILFGTCIFEAMIYGLFMVFPPLWVVFALSICYGIANASLMTVEYALACDTLPSKGATARDLGLW
eukprot:CAMPEP_0184487760 /NCGR_PEP_ID=MMETSP0113_2-20130426/10318_1 /TAXON_ID=91329 /ORGANISM="Norrisiella sphaerica, Strain BC52" /LENGTH=390 /DNA_ID=CAMNT_0026870163 /DNA_START=429 /DNA_END=1598 /DNA_ORIENTATION=-